MYIYSQVKKGTFPTIENLQKASESADITNGLQADSRPLYYVLQKIANNAPRVSGIMTTRKTAVTSYDWRLKAYEQSNEQKAKDKYLSVKKIINSIINNHIEFNVFGQYLSEIIYDANNTINPFSLKKYDLTDFQKMADNKLRLYNNDDGTFKDIEIVPNQTQYLFATDGRIEHGGDFSSIAKHAIYLNDILSEWNLIVKRVKGIAIGSVDSAISALDNMANDLKDAPNGYAEGLAAKVADGAGYPTDASRSQARYEGRIPLLSAKLKKFIRDPGEGNFSDSDQKNLLMMMPSENDSVVAKKEKLMAVREELKRLKQEKSGTAPGKKGFKYLGTE